MKNDLAIGYEGLVAALRAVAEPTRLRVLNALRRTELTVGEICSVVGQSQPRVSRHLKILVDARLLDRHSQGTSAYYRITVNPAGRQIVDAVLGLLDLDDVIAARDLGRVEAIRERRAVEAADYFESIASSWNEMRTLHVEDAEVEKAILDAVGSEHVENLLDIGTGTGRMLSLFADRIDDGIGIDSSRQMLNVARANLDSSGDRHCRVRHGDVYDLGLEPGSFDVAVLHHVLHFLDDPAMAIAEAATMLGSGGRVVIVDFAPHRVESLLFEHRHRHLGFAEAEVEGWIQAAGLTCEPTVHLVPASADADQPTLTTTIWTARSTVSLATAVLDADRSIMEEAS
ncbi:MAG: metalloregulator ArsR/SmtB family transcription factor [Actinomycetia bacterium]|nr:metalloregulator ArsR/SmtB family transcription factor [Actinomycetes bacterium]